MKTRFFILGFLLITLMACGWLNTDLPTHLPATALPASIATPPAVPTASMPTAAVPAVVVSTGMIPTPTVSPSPTAGPPWEWQRSSPEEQGVSSAVLAGMLESVQQEDLNLHSVIVIRHGVLILEAYLHPFNAQTRHSVYSVTKSVTSTLVGIAGAEGALDVHAPVISYFPHVTLDDPGKEAIHVEHLLSMTSGIEWMEPLNSGLSYHWGILESDDPAQYFFTSALLAEPGTLFNYNSGGSHLLSMLVQEVSGQTAADFAAEKLFAPLDIRDYAWKSDFTGHTWGGTGLELLPADMAKIGQVILNSGVWQGVQVVPADWVDAATRVHSTSSPKLNYGYQWWIRPQGDFFAMGWGGQQIRVFPDEDMVVVFTAGLGGNAMLQNELVDNYLFPSVKSDDPLPADAQAEARLDNAIAALANPQVHDSAPISPLAHEVDGKLWLATGRGSWSMFSLHYLSETEALFDLEQDADMQQLLVGLDGIYRISETTDYGPSAQYGYWETPDTFVLVQQYLRDADWRRTHIQFSDDTFTLYSEWFVEPYQEESEGVLFGE